MIHIKKHGELYVKFVGLDIPTAQKIYTQFSFFRADYLYSRNNYKHDDDGRVHLFNPYKHTLPKGLLLDATRLLKDLNRSFTLDPQLNIPDFTAYIEDFLKIQHKFPYQEHQLDLIKRSLRLTSGTIQSPTASGKSFVIFALVVFFKKYLNCRVLITVPNISLVTQLDGDFKDYDVHGFLKDEVQMIHGALSKELDPSKSVVISTYQSATKLPPAFFTNFNVYIQDEVHGGDTTSSMYILNNLAQTAKYRFGLTGTFKNNDINKIKGGLNLLQVRGYFGFHIQGATTKNLIDSGVLPPLKITLIKLQHKPQAFFSYVEEVNYIVDCEPRDKFISALPKILKGNTLILTDRRLHGSRIFDMLPDGYHKFLLLGDYSDTDHKSSKTKKQLLKERDEVKAFAETHDNVIIVATNGLFSTGQNVKNLHNLILAHPSKSSVRVLQSIGRTLRKHESKKFAHIIDVIDDFGYNSHTFKHANERIKLYKAEQHEYTAMGYNLY